MLFVDLQFFTNFVFNSLTSVFQVLEVRTFWHNFLYDIISKNKAIYVPFFQDIYFLRKYLFSVSLYLLAMYCIGTSLLVNFPTDRHKLLKLTSEIRFQTACTHRSPNTIVDFSDERNTLCPYGSAYQKVPSKKQSLPVAVAQQATTSHQTEEPILSKAVFTHKNSETSTASAVETTDESGVTSNYAKVATTADILETNGPLNKDISSESTSELAVQTPTVSRQELSDHLRVLTTTEVSTFQHTDLQRLPGTDQAAESPLSNSHALGRERLEITSARKTDEADTSTRTPAVTEKDRNYLKNEENAEGSTTSNVIEAVSALLENHAHANSAISKHASETVIHGAESTTETSTSTPNPAKDWLSYSATTSQTSTLDVERPDVQVLTNNNDGNSRWRAESAYVRKPVYARVDRLPSIFRSGGQSLSDGVSSSQQTRIPVAEPVATSRKTPVSTHEVPTPEPLPR